MRECEKSLLHSPSLTLTLSFCLLVGDRVIKLGEKQRAVCPSEEVVESSEIQGIAKRPAMTNISDATLADMITD